MNELFALFRKTPTITGAYNSGHTAPLKFGSAELRMSANRQTV